MYSFHDIIRGSNGSYNAKLGFDNCTGFGSVKATILYQIINYSLTLNTSSLSLTKNTTYQLIPTSNYNFNTHLSWSSGNPKIAKVSSSGLVTAIGIGTTTILLRTINLNVIKIITVAVRNVTKTQLYLISNKYKNI